MELNSNTIKEREDKLFQLVAKAITRYVEWFEAMDDYYPNQRKAHRNEEVYKKHLQEITPDLEKQKEIDQIIACSWIGNNYGEIYKKVLKVLGKE